MTYAYPYLATNKNDGGGGGGGTMRMTTAKSAAFLALIVLPDVQYI